jgi:hypothetical protein
LHFQQAPSSPYSFNKPHLPLALSTSPIFPLHEQPSIIIPHMSSPQLRGDCHVTSTV